MALFSVLTSGFKNSAKEMKNIRCLATTGVLIAVYIVLEVYCSFDTGAFKVNFAYLSFAVIGMLFGPVVAMIAAVPCDVLAVVFKGFTVNPFFVPIAILEALIYSLFLYKEKYVSYAFTPAKLRIIVSKIINVIICNLFLNTFAYYYTGALLSGLPVWTKYATYWDYFKIKIIKNVLEIPFDLVLTYFVVVSVSIAYSKTKKLTNKGVSL